MKIDSGRMLNDYIQPNKKQYCIPVFQRDYAWTSEHCEKLFEDIVLAFKKDRPHFMGKPRKKILFSGYQMSHSLTLWIMLIFKNSFKEYKKRPGIFIRNGLYVQSILR